MSDPSFGEYCSASIAVGRLNVQKPGGAEHIVLFLVGAVAADIEVSLELVTLSTRHTCAS